MTTRIGRRQRKRRHKLAMKVHPVRMWGARQLGREFQRMLEFEALGHDPHEVEFVGGPWDGKIYVTEDLSPYFHVATCDLPDLYSEFRATNTVQDVLTVTYKRQIRKEGRMFYDGRNRRMRHAPTLMIVQT